MRTPSARRCPSSTPASVQEDLMEHTSENTAAESDFTTPVVVAVDVEDEE
ncbi:hypothetical protein [Streptomyces sp. NPDC088812]